MAWHLTDEETTRLMEAVWAAVAPYWGERDLTYTWVAENGTEEIRTTRTKGLNTAAPRTIVELCSVYEDIITKGAVAVDPFVLAPADPSSRMEP
jgi:hypothetical protein